MSPRTTERSYPFAFGRPGRTRLGERIVAVFGACVVLPLIVLGALSLGHVHEQLDQQAAERLVRSNKILAFSVYERLLSAGRRLRDIELAGVAKGDVAATFAAVWRTGPGGEAVALFGEPLDLETPDKQELAHLERGMALLRFAEHEGRLLPVLEILRAEQRIAVRIDSTFLFGTDNNLSPLPDSEFCVATSTGIPVWCSAGAISHIQGLPTHRSSAGWFPWTVRDEPFDASYRALFVRPEFGGNELIFILGQPRATVLAPIEDFQRRVPLLLGLTLCVVFLACLVMIGRLLRPLERLSEATRAVARRDFSSRVEVQSRDEFGELATSFNSMSDQIRHHLDALALMSEIDRSVLAATDTRVVVDTVLWRVPDLVASVWIGILLPAPERGRQSALHWRDVSAGSPPRDREFVLDGGFWKDTDALEPVTLFDRDAELGALIEPQVLRKVEKILRMPLQFGREALGLLVVGLTDDSPDEAMVQSVRHVADQAATALSNARMVEKIQYFAHHDALTRLPNRYLLEERLDQAVTQAKRHDHHVGVMFVDLDHFKRINDTMGHDRGDELICQAAERISSTLRIADTLASGRAQSHIDIARLGGDEFIILLSDLERPDEAGSVAKRVLTGLEQPFRLDDDEIVVTASIGISIFPFDGSDAKTLLQHADTAMYRAKAEGRNDFRFFGPEMNAQAVERAGIEVGLRAALTDSARGLALHYQPIVDAKSGAILGAEALARWNDPQLGCVSPDRFVAVAEQTGLISLLGDWTLLRACEQLQHTRGAGIPISVNVSARQFRDAGFCAKVGEFLRDQRLDPTLLTLEITETAAMEKADVTLATMRALREAGVRLAVDDFGTGYASMRYLRDFPIDYLKIDKSFVDRIDTDDATRAVVLAVVGIAHALGLEVVAEGVERGAQRAVLLEMGCERIQGHLFSPAVPGSQLIEMIHSGGVLEPDGEDAG